MAVKVITMGATLIGISTAAPAQEIALRSAWGEAHAVLEDSSATSALLGLLPVTLQMHDHLRQEKTGKLPVSLPDLPRHRNFSAGKLGLWGRSDFVIYYRDGTVPAPGIVPLGRVTGDVTIFDRPGDITLELVAR